MQKWTELNLKFSREAGFDSRAGSLVFRIVVEVRGLVSDSQPWAPPTLIKRELMNLVSARLSRYRVR